MSESERGGSFAEELRKCACCGEKPPALMRCSVCREVGYCGRDCQRKHWKLHKPNCGARATLDSMGQPDPEMERLTAEAWEHNNKMKAAKKAKTPFISLSMTSFGMVGMGMPIPDGVPPNFGLKQAALIEFQAGAMQSPGASRGNFKGEKSYRDYYDDLEDNKEQWLAFFDHPANYQHAEHTCGILGTLATIYRQRGDYSNCAAVLDMEQEVLFRYHRVSVGSSPAQMRCYDGLNFKWRHIRYNMCFDTKRYDDCCGLFREMAAYEIKTDCHYDNQNYLYLMVVLLGKKPTVEAVASLTDAEVLKMVLAPCDFLNEREALESQAVQQRKVALHSCAACARKEAAIGQFKFCQQCKVTFYCSKACQKADWKVHKKGACCAAV